MLTRYAGLHGTRRGARSCGMEISEAEAIAGEPVNVWGSDLPSKARQVTEPKIICYNDQEVGTLRSTVLRHLSCRVNLHVDTISLQGMKQEGKERIKKSRNEMDSR